MSGQKLTIGSYNDSTLTSRSRWAAIGASLFGTALSVFSILSVVELGFKIDFLKPGITAVVYTPVGAVFLAGHIATMVMYLLGTDDSNARIIDKVSKFQQFLYYSATWFFVVVYLFNVLFLWRFYKIFCSNDHAGTISTCPVPSFVSAPITAYNSYYMGEVVNALFVVILVPTTYAVWRALWYPVVGETAEISAAGTQYNEKPTSSYSLSHSAFFYFGIAFLLTLLVYGILSFIEAFFDVNFLDPWPYVLTFTIIGGFLFVLTIISFVIYKTRLNSTLPQSTEEMAEAGGEMATTPLLHELIPSDEQFAELNCTIGFWLVWSFAVFLFLLWAFYINSCTGATSINPNCDNPGTIADCTGAACEDVWNWEYINGVIGFSFVYFFALVIVFGVVACSSIQLVARQSAETVRQFQRSLGKYNNKNAAAAAASASGAAATAAGRTGTAKTNSAKQ